LYRFASPFELPDMDAAVTRLQAAIAVRQPILVWGDFDTDGITATALLVLALRAQGALVDWHVPDRVRESHGVHWPTLQPFLGQGTRLLITCDTGVTAHEALALAQHAGLDVIVTDHHALPDVLPPALAVVNPARLPEGHPLRHLSGAGVAQKLAEALAPGQGGLDLATLGMIADVTPQRGDVRAMLQQGLALLRRTERAGIRALLEVADVEAGSLDEEVISYQVAPRLNAIGRLANASAGVELLLTDDLTRARVIAAELEALNTRRQLLSRQLITAAQDQLQRQSRGTLPSVLVLSHPKWPEGILGIAAGHLAQRYARPVVLIATPEGEPARGSARSVMGVDIHAALSQVSPLLTGFGGHPMAAGFSMAADRVAELRTGLTTAVEGQIGRGLPEPQLAIDGYLALSDLNLDILRAVRRLAPFGPGNPRVTLATRDLKILGQRTLGRTAEHRLLRVQDGAGTVLETVWWQSADLPVPDGTLDLAYGLRERPETEAGLQLNWIDARLHEPATLELASEAPTPPVADYRMVPDPLITLRALWVEGETQLWAEASCLTGFEPRGRHKLLQGGSLVVWTAPPSLAVWRQVLATARPERVLLMALDPGLDSWEPFTKRLAALVKYAVEVYQGRLEWQAVASAMAHDVPAVRAGLLWLHARGTITILTEDREAATVRSGGLADRSSEDSARRLLSEAMDEARAYRRHFRRADAAWLVADV
jgi:single-stranded-DNA-specific exonuclease